MDSCDVLRECTVRGLAVHADALQMMKEYVQNSISQNPLHALIDAIVMRLDHRAIRVVNLTIVSMLRKSNLLSRTKSSGI